MRKSIICRLFILAVSGISALVPTAALAHSGKARFHIIVDTDCAADDLRTLCMLLGNREIEVLAVTTSEGALPPHVSARRAATLLGDFHHQGIPVGAGRETGAAAPAWRTLSGKTEWGDTTRLSATIAAAPDLIIETIEGEDEKVTFVALGALTNIGDALAATPSIADRLERIVWYNDGVRPLSGANYEADKAAAEKVIGSGIDMVIVSADPDRPQPVTQQLLDSISTVRTPYARKIVGSHAAEPLAPLVSNGHLKLWDDLVAVYLFAPELFETERIGDNLTQARLREASTAQAEERIVTILRGKPDSESRVFYGFPTDSALYAADVAPMIDKAIDRHGPNEWRAAVLTNELHGHLGIYATIGVKMGIRAREYFNIGVDDIAVTTYAGSRPPVSCMNDGLQVGTGASVGHGLITVAECGTPRPEALFRFKNKSVHIALKPEYARRIRDDVKRGIELYGDLTEPYWQYVRGLALKYWAEFDRHEIFDIEAED